MATILLAWELGGGLGHMMNLRPLAQELPKRGHRVVLALRDLSRAHDVFGESRVEYVQAPFKHQRHSSIEPTCTYAQILHNCGFGGVGELTTLTAAWQTLFDSFKPDLIVFDHSPTALLAARSFPARRAVIGNGFTVPPDDSPLPNLRASINPDWTQLKSHEAHVLENINEVLKRRSEPPIERVARLFHPIDETLLLTFAELDSYPQRTGATYWGKSSIETGEPPQWPPGNGLKIFGYIKPFPALPNLITMLQQLANPKLIYAPGIDNQIRTLFGRPNFRFADGPVNLVQAAEQCDLAILNGTHTSAATMLLAGKPALHIPIFLEHGMNADAVARLAAGIKAMPNDLAQISDGLEALLHSEQFGHAARAFAARYADFDPATQTAKLIDRVDELASS